MNTSLYVAYAGLQADMHALDVAANNLANVVTTGFREERSFQSVLEASGIFYPRVGGTETNTQPGPFATTGRDLDVAIDGPGFLVVETSGGRRYTRDGGLSLDEQGRLVNRTGLAVMGQGGTIEAPPGKIDIDPDGRLSVSGVQAGRLLLVEMDERTLSHEGGGLYRRDGSATDEPPSTESRLRQGYLEKSNVDLPSGNVGQLRRHFQSLSRAIQVVDGLDRRLLATVRAR